MKSTGAFDVNEIIIKMGANHAVSEISQSLFNMGCQTNEVHVIKCLRTACIVPHTQESINKQRGIISAHNRTEVHTETHTSKKIKRVEHVARIIENPILNKRQRYETITKRDGYQCQICGKTQSEIDHKCTSGLAFNNRLHVHHISPHKHKKSITRKDKRDHRPSNLITLCKECHWHIHKFNHAVKRLNKHQK